MLAQVSFVLLQFTRLTDRGTDRQKDTQTFRLWLRPPYIEPSKK